MKFASTLLALPAVATAAFYPPEMYQRGEVHQMILNMKNEQWNAMEVAGLLNSSQYPSWKTWDQLDKKVKNDCLRCRDGLAIAEQGNANYTFRCNNMDAYDFLNHADMGGGENDPRYPNRRGSSIKSRAVVAGMEGLGSAASPCRSREVDGVADMVA